MGQYNGKRNEALRLIVTQIVCKDTNQILGVKLFAAGQWASRQIFQCFQAAVFNKGIPYCAEIFFDAGNGSAVLFGNREINFCKRSGFSRARKTAS